MDRDFLMVASLASLLVVLLSTLIALTPGPRRHRIGVTLLACWASFGLSIYGLRVLDDPLPVRLYWDWWGPLGLSLAAWALLDVSRLARHYGTTTLMQAADIARGFLLSPRVEHGIWAQWAEDLPSAAWLKSPNGVMLAVNRHYAHTYGKPQTEYVGATDSDVWAPHVASAFADADRDVYNLGTPVFVREPAPTWANPERQSMMLKFPVRDHRGTIVGVGGIELIRPPESGDEHEGGGP